MKNLLQMAAKLICGFVGSFSWQPPAWVTFLGRIRKNRPAVFWGLGIVFCVALVGAGIGYQYYQSLPKPILIIAEIEVPYLTANVDEPQPESLIVEFVYDYDNLLPEQELPEDQPSVARIDLVDQVVKTGITLKPALPGSWFWREDQTLVFSPLQEWPAGTEFTVTFDRSLFVAEAHFKELEYQFTTLPFTASIEEIDFYQDPEETTVRKVVSTLVFSHPVNKQSLKQHLSMSMRPSGASSETPARNYPFKVEFDKNQREAYIHSEPVTLPNDPNYMQLTIAPGVEPGTGGKATAEASSEQVLIPDAFSFLKIEEARSRIVRNEKNEPEQVLTLQFTDDISEVELLNKLKIYLLPKRNPNKNVNYWRSPREITPNILQDATAVDLQLIPNPRGSSKVFSFVYDGPKRRYLYLHIEPGLTSVNKFVKSTLYDNVIQIPNYPKEIVIMGEGSMLSLAGAHQLSLLTRGLDAFRVQIGKLLPGQLNHLVSQSDGDIKDIHFKGYSFDENNIVEYKEEIIDLKRLHPKQANYASVDLTSYLPNQNNRFGLFFISVTGWDKQREKEIRSARDKRVILVTDLGLLVKNNADQSHLVFVQSISNGGPVAGADVELLGRNGLPLFSRKTDVDGRAVFPSTRGFKNEQQPNVYVVKTANDVSFIPFRRSERRINYSQFEVGGVRSQHQNRDNLNAFLFSDRGIYRPGEVVEIGCIVKDRTLGNIEDIPLEIAIRGPRGSEVQSHKLKLPEKGFFDHPFDSQATSETGTYQVSLYLVRDGKYRDRMIGSASFRIEEFQPDTLKIESTLLDLPERGWTSNAGIKARVQLKSLFGASAQERKVTGRISVRASNFKFKGYENFTFNDPYFDPKKRPLNLNEDLESQKTDTDGVAYFDIPLDRFDRGTYQLTFDVEGFEPGDGRSVAARNKALLSPLSALVGYKSDGKLDYVSKNAERNIELIAINSALQQIALDKLHVRLVEVQNISTLVKQNNGTFKYQTVTREKPQEMTALAIGADGEHYRLPTETPGEYILEILNEKELRLARISFNVVGHGNLLGKLEKNAELTLKLDKKDYKAGDLVEMSITAPYIGAGLITIENDRVQAHKWFRTRTNSTIETIRIPKHLEG
ncbi:MAG: alpha-2-macroglobulin family protein, partial [Deltaproteobacteria bacterium]|nr:alpha-2-macroglobulin family protein [Deltaproteobacteria bacterium]